MIVCRKYTNEQYRKAIIKATDSAMKEWGVDYSNLSEEEKEAYKQERAWNTYENSAKTSLLHSMVWWKVVEVTKLDG